MNWQKFQQEDARLTILILLSKQNDWTLNEHVIRPGLSHLGHTLSKDKLRVELSWLKEIGLIKMETRENIQVVKLLNRGLDVAQGNTEVPGVQKPSPEDD